MSSAAQRDSGRQRPRPGASRRRSPKPRWTPLAPELNGHRPVVLGFAAAEHAAQGAAIAATRCGVRRCGLEFGPSLRRHRQRPPARADLRRGGVPRSGRSRRCPGPPRRGQARATHLDPGSLRRDRARPGRGFDHVRRHRAAPSGEGCPEGGRRGSLGDRRAARHPDPRRGGVADADRRDAWPRAQARPRGHRHRRREQRAGRHRRGRSRGDPRCSPRFGAADGLGRDPGSAHVVRGRGVARGGPPPLDDVTARRYRSTDGCRRYGDQRRETRSRRRPSTGS